MLHWTNLDFGIVVIHHLHLGVWKYSFIYIYIYIYIYILTQLLDFYFLVWVLKIVGMNEP